MRHQRQAGLEPIAVTSAQQPFGNNACDHEIEGIVHHRTAPVTAPRFPLARERALMRALQTRTESTIRRTRPDVVHAHSPVLVGLPALRAAREYGIPFVYEVRDLWENASVDRGKFAYGSLSYRAARALETYVLRHADEVITICESLRAELAARTNRRVTVVPNGVDPNHLRQPDDCADLRRRWGLNSHRVLAYVGTYQPYEGLDLLIRALPAVLRDAPDVKLLIAGGAADGAAVEVGLRAIARDLGVADAVMFAGRIPHQLVAAAYSAADVLVYPRVLTRTTALTTPLKPIEAMAMGRPVVASDVPAMMELVRHGRTGLLFRAGAVDDLARQCLLLLEHPDFAASLGALARDWALRTRQWSTLVSTYQGVYRDLVAQTAFVPAPAVSVSPAATVR